MTLWKKIKQVEIDLNIERAALLDSTTLTRGFANRFKYTDSLSYLKGCDLILCRRIKQVSIY